jgi:phosphopantetheine adenylyltransferase
MDFKHGLRKQMKRQGRYLPIGIFLCIVFLMSGCGKRQLENDELPIKDRSFRIAEEAQIKDTKETRDILEVLARYRKAVVEKDFRTIKHVVSEDYYDNAGTTDTTEDDYGWPELKEQILELMANHAQKIQYTIVVQNVEVENEEAKVDFEYDFAYRYKVGENSTWDAGLETNRIEMIKSSGGEWKIVSGL